MNFDEIEQKADEFFEWQHEINDVVSLVSAKLFAKHCVDIALMREAEKDKDDGK